MSREYWDFFMTIHEKWMNRALILAEKGRGYTSPNPVVGAVLIKNDTVISEGCHKKFGAPHAELIAIGKAGNNAKGATLYVNLEPCCFHGKTPPCVDAIIRSGIKEVIIGIIDPNPQVNGNGIRILEDAGIVVKVGILEKEAKTINRGFFKYIKKNRPWITLKLAITADGFIADVTGKSKWITSEPARQFVKEQRSFHDAVMVGMGTVFKDNPSLLPESTNGLIPYRIILDEVLNIPFRFKLVSDDFKKRTVILTSQKGKKEKVKQLKSAGINVLNVASDDFGWIKLPDALRSLAKFGITSVYCEGGGQVAGSLITQKVVDELQLFISPKILGEGISSFGGFMRSLDEAINLNWGEPIKLGQDIFLKGTIV